MFSFKGRIAQGTEKKNGYLVAVSESDFTKIMSECKALLNHFPVDAQPLYPCYNTEDGHYVKVLLSKARKEQYTSLLERPEEITFNVRAMPYSFANHNSGTINGFSLYYQGEFIMPKKFRRAT
jgi:hypothetical protein